MIKSETNMYKTVKSTRTNHEIPSRSGSTSPILVKFLKRIKTIGCSKTQTAPSRWMNRFQQIGEMESLPFKSPQLYLHFYSHKQFSLTFSLSHANLSSVMASIDSSMNPQSNLFQQEPLLHQMQHDQQPHSSLPHYPEMIMAAIEALDEKIGSSKAAISKQMESTYPDLPAAHATLLAHHLEKMKQEGQLVLVKNNYMKPDPDAPPKRGRGRPPKPKTPLPPGTVVSPPRPRGRPPKARDPFSPPAPPKQKSSGGSGRPRGRPPKKAKTASSTPAVSAPGGTPRGRGRPPKVKPAVAAVAG